MKNAKVLQCSAVLVAALAPALATADSGAQANAPAGGTAQQESSTAARDLGLTGPRPDLSRMTRAGRINVNDLYTGRTASNCTYRATINGHVERWTASGAARGGGPAQGGAADQNQAFVPHLTINTQLSCPGGAIERVAVSTINGPALTQNELERAAESLSEVTSPGEGRTCMYKAAYQFSSEGHFTGRSITQSCVPAVGGGPDQNQNQGNQPDQNAPSDQPSGDMNQQGGGANPQGTNQ